MEISNGVLNHFQRKMEDAANDSKVQADFAVYSDVDINIYCILLGIK